MGRGSHLSLCGHVRCDGDVSEPLTTCYHSDGVLATQFGWCDQVTMGTPFSWCHSCISFISEELQHC